ncbi:MAG: hypothetical protein KAV87_51625 [Desulfobacteraceae bacterium]|nr:hypothetical protein [Desulfobacteraceae bacterium]
MHGIYGQYKGFGALVKAIEGSYQVGYTVEDYLVPAGDQLVIEREGTDVWTNGKQDTERLLMDIAVNQGDESGDWISLNTWSNTVHHKLIENFPFYRVVLRNRDTEDHVFSMTIWTNPFYVIQLLGALKGVQDVD